jgi:ABC-type lipoprotein release transport system permease subunit
MRRAAAAGSTLRIAWRNLWRSRRRTALALAAIGLSSALVLVYDGVLRAYGDWLLEAITGPLLGHVQAHAPGWRKDRAMDRTLRGVSGAVEAVRRDPGVAAASARVYAPALAAVGEEGFAVVVVGIDPRADAGPMRLLGEGVAFLGERRAVMGRPLADLMGVRPGAVVALVGQGADGSLANDLFRVSALVDTSVDLVNRQGVILDLAEAQELFAMPDEAHEIVVHARDPETVKALAARLAALPSLAGTEVLDWQTLAPEMTTLVALVRVAWVFILVLVFVAAAAGVANTMLMATFERTHELGMLLALGTAPARIVGLIVVESLALGVVGALLGTALGGTLVAVAHHTGVDYAALTGGGPQEISFAGLRWSLRLYPRLAVADVVRVIAAVVVTSLAACVWPAVRAARLPPARALRE